MAKQFDNTISVFSRPATVFPAAAAAVFSGVGLLAGLVIALATRNWPFVAVSLISMGGLGAFGYLIFVHIRRLSAGAERGRIDWKAAPPDVQRESLNVEVRELSRLLEVGSDQISDLQSAYIVAEDLALRQIQQEENALLLRHTRVGGVPFDAVMVKHDLIVCVEVAFLVTPDLRQDKIDAVIRKIASAQKFLDTGGVKMRVRLMLALVTQLVAEDERALRTMLNKQRFGSTPVDIDIRLLDFEELQRVFVVE